MCHAVIDVKFKNTKDRDLRRVETKEQLAKDLLQLERLGTVEAVTVYKNHHTHKLTEAWTDVLYSEPEPPADPATANKAILDKAFNNDPKVTP